MRAVIVYSSFAWVFVWAWWYHSVVSLHLPCSIEEEEWRRDECRWDIWVSVMVFLSYKHRVGSMTVPPILPSVWSLDLPFFEVKKPAKIYIICSELPILSVGRRMVLITDLSLSLSRSLLPLQSLTLHLHSSQCFSHRSGIELEFPRFSHHEDCLSPIADGNSQGNGDD